MRFIQNIIVIALLLCMAGCSTVHKPTYLPIPPGGKYRVATGDSLYSIALRYNLDYRKLAKRNGMTRPYYVYRGETLYLVRRPVYAQAITQLKTASQKPYVTEKPAVSHQQAEAKKGVKHSSNLEFIADDEPTDLVRTWLWPAKGTVALGYSKFNKGINIEGSVGQPIFATAGGKVIYCGHGLRDYGNLIIIKHNSIYLTAYAHAREIFVNVGDWVKQGQKIAEMGQTSAHKAQLHFEIREQGEPVNPMNYLAKNA